ncbi:MAG: GDP-mannose 4,6-dehydratase [Oligoflexales bacterium]|nr:GDP-mannose 4,6-dehydratase [Oligoflexales bacterium]
MKRDLGKVYVTGADGFIGSHLVEALVERGVEVTALCIYNSFGSYGWLDPYADNCPKNLKLIFGDVRDPFFLESTIRGHDTVFHLASLIAIPFSYQAPQSYFETNAMGTLGVAEACRKNGVKRLLHTSTSEVYGTARFVPITEDHPLQGQSPYSASKIAADKIIESYFRSFELPFITVRPFNTYGPRQSLRAVIPTVISQIMSERREIHLGATSPTRDFNFVSDTVDAFIAIAESDDEKLPGETFNVGSGREISIGDFVTLAARSLGKQVSVFTENERLRPEKSEVERLLADAGKLIKVTGWRPRVSLEEGILRVSEWIKENPKLYERSKIYVR